MNPVKRECLDRGWTQRDLADKLEVKQSTIAKWERKKEVYRKKTRQKSAGVFKGMIFYRLSLSVMQYILSMNSIMQFLVKNFTILFVIFELFYKSLKLYNFF
jgi:transcriptional regulator with XRE-family HTH domain